MNIVLSEKSNDRSNIRTRTKILTIHRGTIATIVMVKSEMKISNTSPSS